MTEGHATKSERTARLETLFWIAFFFAIVPNTIDAFADPSGDWWTALRIALSTIFVLVLVALVASKLADRRRV
jgi:hypothetical protein